MKKIIFLLIILTSNIAITNASLANAVITDATTTGRDQNGTQIPKIFTDNNNEVAINNNLPDSLKDTLPGNYESPDQTKYYNQPIDNLASDAGAKLNDERDDIKDYVKSNSDNKNNAYEKDKDFFNNLNDETKSRINKISVEDIDSLLKICSAPLSCTTTYETKSCYERPSKKYIYCTIEKKMDNEERIFTKEYIFNIHMSTHKTTLVEGWINIQTGRVSNWNQHGHCHNHQDHHKFFISPPVNVPYEPQCVSVSARLVTNDEYFGFRNQPSCSGGNINVWARNKHYGDLDVTRPIIVTYQYKQLVNVPSQIDNCKQYATQPGCVQKDNGVCISKDQSGNCINEFKYECDNEQTAKGETIGYEKCNFDDLKQNNCQLVKKQCEDPSRECDQYGYEYMCTKKSCTQPDSRCEVYCQNGYCDVPEYNKTVDDLGGYALTRLSSLLEAAKSSDQEHAFAGEMKSCNLDASGSCAKDSELSLAIEEGRAVYVGRENNKLIYCTFPTRVARILQVAVRSEENRNFGTANLPDCSGFPVTDLIDKYQGLFANKDLLLDTEPDVIRPTNNDETQSDLKSIIESAEAIKKEKEDKEIESK